MRFPKLTEERHSRQAGALARAKPSRGGARTNGSAVVACSAELLLSSTVSENPSAAESSMSPSICRLAPSRSECGIALWLALQGVRDRLTRRPIYQHTILFALITVVRSHPRRQACGWRQTQRPWLQACAAAARST